MQGEMFPGFLEKNADSADVEDAWAGSQRVAIHS
jgi:hypothetical protein